MPAILYKAINWYVQHFDFPCRGWKYARSFLRFCRLNHKVYQKKILNGLYINVCPEDHIQKEIFWYGHYEKNAIGIWSLLIQEDSIAIDVGANIGYYTIVASRKAALGHVYAFEPISSLRDEIEKNIRLNRLNNVTICPFALFNMRQDLIIYISSVDNVGMSGIFPAENFSGKKENVPAISLDEWLELEQIKKINFVKIDVEGAEVQVLEGMKKTLSTFRPVIFIEAINDQLLQLGSSYQNLYKYIRSHNYEAYDIVGENTIKHLSHEKEGYSILFFPQEFKFPNRLNIITQSPNLFNPH